MSLGDQQWPWFAVMARAGREKHATLHLENSGYECYLPIRRLTRRWSDRAMKIGVPLFPGYLFCRMNPQNRLPILMTPGVIQIVGVGKTPASVDEDEIAAIQQVEKHSLSAEPWPYPQIGHPVRIEEGPLKGAMGVVVRVKTGMKLVLSVSLLRRSVAVEVDRRWLGDTRETSEAGPVVGEPLRVMATQARIAASCSEGPGAG